MLFFRSGTVLLLFLLLWGVAAHLHAESFPTNEELFSNKMSTNMHVAATWVLERGLQTVHNNGAASVNRMLIDQWAVQLAVKNPGIEDGYDIAYFPITAKGIHYDIRCLHRISVKDIFYEYWLFNIRGPERFHDQHAEFYITRSTHIKGQREVVFSSSQFIKQYEIDGVSLELPTNDLQLLYKMEAWKYPSSYKGSELAELEVSLDKRGYYIVEKSWPKKIGHLFHGLFGPKRSRYRK